MRLDHITPKLGVSGNTQKTELRNRPGNRRFARESNLNSCIRPNLKKRRRTRKTTMLHKGLLDDHRAVEPPESIPNSEVKRSIADGSVGLPHVRVGHRQALK